MTEAPFRCFRAALRRDDQRLGTAAPADRWLLVEHPGPWARRAFDTTPTLTNVSLRANRAGVRAVLIRRYGRQTVGADRAWAYVDSRRGQEGSWWGRYTHEEDLLDVPLEPAGTATGDPTYLVCAHGRHDPCCAIQGRPVTAALSADRPDRTWECSHIGGDRFAANLIALPHGFYYGHLEPSSARAVADAYEAGLVVPEWLRGRSSVPPQVQAAQHYAREATGDRSVDAFPPLDAVTTDDRHWRVRLGTTGGAVEVVVRMDLAPPAMLTCGAHQPDTVRTFALVSLDKP